MGEDKIFHDLGNDANIRDRSIVVRINVIKTSFFDHRCDKS